MIQNWTKYASFFKEREFDSKDFPGSGSNMDEVFMDMLYAARWESQRIDPMVKWVITSGYRTPEHNAKVSTSSDSPHLRGVAADILVDFDNKRYIILSCLLKVGFKRLGIGKDFIHCDIDTAPGKAQELIWVYPDR